MATYQNDNLNNVQDLITSISGQIQNEIDSKADDTDRTFDGATAYLNSINTYWNESMQTLISKYKNLINEAVNTGKFPNFSDLTIDDIKNADAGFSFSSNPYVKPNTNMDGKTFLQVRGADIINSVLKNSSNLQFTKTQEKSYLRLLMPKYSRRVEVEDLNRNFWVIGQVIDAICDYLFNPNSLLNKILGSLLAELVETWQNIFRLWEAIFELDDKIKKLKEELEEKIEKIKEMLGYSDIQNLDLVFKGQSISSDAYFSMWERLNLSNLSIKLSSNYGERYIDNILYGYSSTHNYAYVATPSGNTVNEAAYNKPSYSEMMYKYSKENNQSGKFQQGFSYSTIFTTGSYTQGECNTLDQWLYNYNNSSPRTPGPKKGFRYTSGNTIMVIYYDRKSYTYTSDDNTLKQTLTYEENHKSINFINANQLIYILIGRNDFIDGEIITVCLNKGSNTTPVNPYRYPNLLLNYSGSERTDDFNSQIAGTHLNLQYNFTGSPSTYNRDSMVSFWKCESNNVTENTSLSDIFKGNKISVWYYNSKNNSTPNKMINFSKNWRVSCFTTSFQEIQENLIIDNRYNRENEDSGIYSIKPIAPILDTGTINYIHFKGVGGLVDNETSWSHYPSNLIVPRSDKATNMQKQIDNSTTNIPAAWKTAFTAPLITSAGTANGIAYYNRKDIVNVLLSLNHTGDDNFRAPLGIIISRRNPGSFGVKKIKLKDMIIQSEGSTDKADQYEYFVGYELNEEQWNNGNDVNKITSSQYWAIETFNRQTISNSFNTNREFEKININNTNYRSMFGFIFYSNLGVDGSEDNYLSMPGMFCFGETEKGDSNVVGGGYPA